LVADSSEAHLKPALDTGVGNGPCTVVAPFDCPAIRRAQPSEFRDVAALDTCPWLAAAHPRGASGQGALCVPLNVVGRAIGVLQIAAPTSSLPTGSQTRAVEAIAEHAGTRIGMLRVLETTSLQAATDPLTGLLNRRSLENQASELFRSDAPVALAMGDLDYFKQLNDTFGHDTGDRALRVFARTVRSVLRSEDLISRYGGEEFVIVFPAQSSSTAAGALERVREALALAAVAGSVPAFTASFGVASSVDAQSLDELIKSADAALFQSKHDGRNRVTIAGIANHNKGAESFPGSPDS
jgi:diguanylate cyclase (GGDEF)-like protein